MLTILTILAGIGLTFILKQGRIFDEIRLFLSSKSELLKYLLSCAMCLGFWSGLLISLLVNPEPVWMILCAFTVSILSYCLQLIIYLIEEIILFFRRE